uniref:Retrovirus-related Pol polyprotein from transposon TNT 1-94 n=1 Tax=Tanacetum cinerariifolium TaxID=118510 RepID=A0A699GVH6_TANCI|nr:retrovirus-related Pol polyprotein from transposon TNT 1-94 [Tanacetum cinerariifolium]
MSKNDMKNRICTLSKNDLKDLVKTYHIPLDLHPRLPDPGFTMDRFSADAIGIYFEIFWFFGIRVPCSTFILFVLKYFKVCISQLVPLGLNEVVSFEVVFRDLNIVPTITLFHVIKCLCKQRDWFCFSKHRNMEDVCMDDGPSSLKKWKDKFFLIDRRAILDYLTWRHSSSCVLDDFPYDGYDRNDVQRLFFRMIDGTVETSIYDFMTLPFWGDAKIFKESNHLSFPLLERVPSHTTASASEGVIISLPTLDEIASSLPDSSLADNAEEADLADLCAEIEDSLERDEGVSMRVVSDPTPRLGKRLGAPPSIVVTSVFDPSHVGVTVPASTSGRSLALGGVVAGGRVGKFKTQIGEFMRRQMDPLDCLARITLARDVEYDQIPDDDFGTATRGEEIDLTLFNLAPGPYHMPYPYEGVSSPLYTREEWNRRHALKINILCKDIFKDLDVCRKASDRTITLAELRRTRSLLPLELSNRVNILSALLVSHGYELNSRYSNLVLSKDHLQEKFDNKKGDVKLLRSEELRSQRDTATEEVRKLQSQLTDAKTTSASLSEELTRIVAKLSDQALTGVTYGRTNIEFEAAVQKVSNFRVGAKDDFDKALDDFPATLFPFLSKIIATSEGGLPDVAQISPEKFAHLATSVAVTSSHASEAPEQVYLSESFRGRGKTLYFHPSTGELTCFFLSPLLVLIDSPRGFHSIYSWIDVIQVLIASSSIALTSAVSTDCSLSSSIKTPFEYSAPSGSIKMRPALDPCSLEAPVSFGPLAFDCVELSSAIVSTKKSASTCLYVITLIVWPWKYLLNHLAACTSARTSFFIGGLVGDDVFTMAFAFSGFALIPLETMSPKNKARYESEKEAIHLMLTGIGDEIYSTVDAFKIAQEMWEAIERLQQELSRFVKIVKQQHKLDEVSYHKLFDILKQYQKEVNELRAERIARNANPLSLVAASQLNQDPYYQTPKSHKPNEPTSKASIPTRSHATTRNKGKEIAKPITPPSESASDEDSDPKQAQRDMDMQKSLALIAKNDNQSTQFGNQRTMTVAGARENVGSLIVQQTGIQCFNCKEFGHFARECKKPKRVKDSTYHKEKMLMCKQAGQGVPLQAEQSDWLADTDEEIDEQELEAHYSYMVKIQEVLTADSGTDSEPLEQVQYDDEYNVFANVNQHCKQSESTSNTCLAEKDDSDVTPDSPDMCEHDIQIDQNAEDKHVVLANLIANLKLNVDENKKIQKQLKKSNTSLAHELEQCKSILVETSKTLEESNSVRDSCLVALQTKQTKFEKYKACNDRTVDYDKLKVAHKTNVSRPQLKSNQMTDKVVPNNSQVKAKKTEVEDHPMNSSISNKTKSVITCNDNLKSKTLNVNAVCATCGKCLIDSNHFTCVTKLLHDVNTRTKKPNLVPISTRNPKSQAKKSIATSHKKTVASKTTTQKSKSYYRMLHEKTRNIMINGVYYVKGLNQNLFSVGQFCDADLKVAFRKSTCFVKDFQGNDLLTGNRGSDLYTISLHESNTSTLIYLMAKASVTQAWLWHQRLSYLNFDYINLLLKKDVVIGLPKLKYVKDQLCSSYEVSIAKRSSFKRNTIPSSKGRLNLLHMDLCGPMRAASINGKKYILVIVDDYSRYTWTLFLSSKDGTPEVLKIFS